MPISVCEGDQHQDLRDEGAGGDERRQDHRRDQDGDADAGRCGRIALTSPGGRRCVRRQAAAATPAPGRPELHAFRAEGRQLHRAQTDDC